MAMKVNMFVQTHVCMYHVCVQVVNRGIEIDKTAEFEQIFPYREILIRHFQQVHAGK